MRIGYPEHVLPQVMMSGGHWKASEWQLLIVVWSRFHEAFCMPQSLTIHGKWKIYALMMVIKLKFQWISETMLIFMP